MARKKLIDGKDLTLNGGPFDGELVKKKDLPQTITMKGPQFIHVYERNELKIGDCRLVVGYKYARCEQP